MSEPLFRIGELSRRTGISADLIRVWERRYGLLVPARSPGNYRLYTAEDLARLRLMQHYLERQVPPARAAELVLQARSADPSQHSGVPAGDVRRALTVLRESLEAFEDGPAERILQRLLGVFSPALVLRDVVLRYLADLGDRWERGAATIAQEHYASAFIESWLLSLGRGSTRAPDKTAVLACMPGEQHRLGLLAFGVILRELGWKVVYLGPDTPIGAVEQAAAATGADAVVLSAALPVTFDAVRDELTRLAHALPVVVGGAGTRGRVDGDLAARVLPNDPVLAARLLARTLDRR